ncbi:unnamed protein product [Nesidiocoris tenuis]|uniref:5'-nucleotidase n=1 Tax=Nesidiocoris tenuis TaxID=355587 RepID=A0A6H5H7X1_9HEMI|nr:unnamed protein product [Nesidiocoris tenuis]
MLVGKFSIFSILLAVKCYSYELNILHVNDVHAHIDGTSRSSGLCREGASCYGGFARVMAKVKELRKSLPNVIFLSAGDMFTGTPYFTKFKSDVLVDFVNEMNFDAQPGKREKVIVHPEIPSLKKAVGDVRKKGAQIVVVVGHSGYEPEMEIAKEVDGIDAVVGGHSHTFLYSGKLPSDDFDKPKGPYPTVVSQITGKKVPVVQAFQFTKYLGHLRLEFDDGFRLVNASGNPILLKPSSPRGKATVAEVSSVLPFRDPIVTLRVTGATLRQALEFSVKDYSSIVGTPRFVQPSGLKVKFNLNKPVGSRMLEAGVYKGLNEPALNLTESDTYLVTMSKFTYHGGDNYTMFRDNNSPIVYQSVSNRNRVIDDLQFSEAFPHLLPTWIAYNRCSDHQRLLTDLPASPLDLWPTIVASHHQSSPLHRTARLPSPGSSPAGSQSCDNSDMRVALVPAVLALVIGSGAIPARSSPPTTTLNIVHVNDLHAHVSGISRVFSSCESGDSCYGGFPRLLAAARQIIERDPNNTLFLNAGDNFQGSVYYTYFKSAVIVDFINRMGFDVLSLGNHEFDDGIAELDKFLTGVNVPIVCANMDLSNEQTMLMNGSKLTNWTMVERAGLRIGVVGYITTETRFTSQPRNVTFLDDVENVRKFAREAKSQGAQIVIALGHSGYNVDQQIAKVVEEVDIVVGGHSHTFLYSGTPPDPEDVVMGPYPTMVEQESGKIVPVVQAYKYSKYLGSFQVELDENLKVISSTGNPILLSPSMPEDPELKTVLEKWDTELSKIFPMNENLTYVTKDARLDECRMAECEIGNLITDAIVEVACEDYPACLGLVNGGSIRSGLKSGNLTAVELIEILPFGNNLTTVQLNGSILMDILETSVRLYDPSGQVQRGGFLQMSGLKVTYDVSQPPGKRVVSATARTANPDKWEPVKPDGVYDVVTSTYIFNGGDNYTEFSRYHLKGILYGKSIHLLLLLEDIA